MAFYPRSSIPGDALRGNGGKREREVDVNKNWLANWRRSFWLDPGPMLAERTLPLRSSILESKVEIGNKKEAATKKPTKYIPTERAILIICSFIIILRATAIRGCRPICVPKTQKYLDMRLIP